MANARTGATLDWAAEESYWRNHYASRPYVRADTNFEYWSPAYRYGYDSARRFQGHRWDEVESDLQSGWDSYEHRGGVRTTWEQIKDAVRDGWDHIVGNK